MKQFIRQIRIGPALCAPHMEQANRFGLLVPATSEESIIDIPVDPGVAPQLCPMCDVVPTADRVCFRDECAKPLPPSWHAVYCTDQCAWADS